MFVEYARPLSPFILALACSGSSGEVISAESNFPTQFLVTPKSKFWRSILIWVLQQKQAYAVYTENTVENNWSAQRNIYNLTPVK